MVKWWCKRPPVYQVTDKAGQTPAGARLSSPLLSAVRAGKSHELNCEI
tara:strand:+ start:8585 stop:8728 length:144 start_codon:yes stop_codon:yes gene_type:complete